MAKKQIAVLDDWMDIAAQMVPWSECEDCAFTFFKEPFADEDAAKEALQPFHGLLLMRERMPLRASLIDALPNLEIVVTAGRRNLSVDHERLKQRNIIYCGTDAVGTGTVELTWSLILNLFHRTHIHAEAMRQGLWQTCLGNMLEGKTIGIVGLGRLGGRVAQIAQAFGMNVIAWSENMTAEQAAQYGATHVSKQELFAQSDLVTIHLVHSPRTRGIVDRASLEQMKPSAYLVNTSRAGIIEEDALLDLLQRGKIAGAALDVYNQEPLPADANIRQCPNLLLTPHVGYVSHENLHVFYAQMLENLQSWCAGDVMRRLDL